MPKNYFFFLSVGAQWQRHDSMQGFDTAARGAAAEIRSSFVKVHRAALRSRKLDKLVAEGNSFNFSFPLFSLSVTPPTPPPSPPQWVAQFIQWNSFQINFVEESAVAGRQVAYPPDPPVSVCREYFYPSLLPSPLTFLGAPQ